MIFHVVACWLHLIMRWCILSDHLLLSCCTPQQLMAFYLLIQVHSTRPSRGHHSRLILLQMELGLCRGCICTNTSAVRTLLPVLQSSRNPQFSYLLSPPPEKLSTVSETHPTPYPQDHTVRISGQETI